MEISSLLSGDYLRENNYGTPYMVTHTGRDCKDDLKLFRYDDSNFELSPLPSMWSLNVFFNNLANKKKDIVEENHAYICIREQIDSE